MENKFAYMEDAVDKICSDLVNDPDRWEVSTYGLTDLKTDIEYWIGSPVGYITNTWNGNSSDRVFSDEQGKRIYEAYRAMRDCKESEAQKRILNTIRPKKNKIGFWSKLFS